MGSHLSGQKSNANRIKKKSRFAQKADSFDDDISDISSSLSGGQYQFEDKVDTPRMVGPITAEDRLKRVQRYF